MSLISSDNLHQRTRGTAGWLIMFSQLLTILLSSFSPNLIQHFYICIHNDKGGNYSNVSLSTSLRHLLFYEQRNLQSSINYLSDKMTPEWCTLIGRDLSRYCTLIGYPALFSNAIKTHIVKLGLHLGLGVEQSDL